MNNTYFGYKMHSNTHFYSTTVLFSKGNENITVSTALDAVGYILNFISATFDTSVNKYRTAITVFQSARLILNNQTPRKPTKDMVKIALDVVEEVANINAKNDEQVKANAQKTLIAKMLIDGMEMVARK